MAPTLHIHLLGDFLLVSGDTPITTITVPRLQSLLAYLLLHRDTPQDRSHLAFLLWPDSNEAQAHTNLRKLLHQLRKSLPDIEQFLQADKHTLQWRAIDENTNWTLDLLEVEQALERAKKAEQAQDRAAIRQALEQIIHLQKGDLLPNCYEEWILPERDRWRQVFLQVAERLIILLEQERDYDAAIIIAQQLLRQDPLHETTYRQLMRLHALRGERAAALRVYHTCVTTLERELGTEPGKATQELYESLIQSDIPSRILTGALTSRGTAPPLLGRKTEWRKLQEVWHKAANGHPHIVILSGEAGIGKTRLAEEMEAWVSRQGMTTASAHCYAALGPLAYAPVTTWLRVDALQTGLLALDSIWLAEIARIVPEIMTKRAQLTHPTAITEGWQRRHFFEALARAVLAAHQPLLLLLDDLQWCDQETLEWLHYLLRFEAQARFLILGTVRAEEMPSEHPLRKFQATLQRDGMVTEIAVGPMTTEETTSLAEHILGYQLDPELSRTLHSETEGNPLFVVEMARAGTLEQNESADPAARGPQPLFTQATSTLPPAVQTVLAARLAQLSPLGHEVANSAAVIGREFTFSVLAQTGKQSEDEIVQGLDELWQRRIVREQGTGTAESYDFSHDKLREQVYISLSPANRRLLHRRVAEAFKEVYRDQDAVSGQIAGHYERAGLPEQAIPYYSRAGETSTQIYANADAITAFQRAITLIEADPINNVKWDMAVQIYTSLGNVLLETGRYEDARKTYKCAMTHVPLHAPLWQARLQRKEAVTWNYFSANPHDAFHVNAHKAFQEAERILTHAADPTNSEWRNEWIDLQFSQVWPLRGSIDDIAAAIEKARPIIEQYGTEEQRERLSGAIGMRNVIRSRYVPSEEAVSSRREALVVALQTGDKGQVGAAHLALGILLLWTGHLDEAEEHLGEALSIAEYTGIAWLQTRSLTFISFIFRRRGQVEGMRDILNHAQEVGATQNNSILTGHRAWVAWRDGNLAEAETYGQKSLEEKRHQQMDIDPFQWVELWPLVGVAFMQEKIEIAIDGIRKLLDPTQQPPPEQLKTLLEAAIQVWDTGQQEEVRAFLEQALPLAREIGYL